MFHKVRQENDAQTEPDDFNLFHTFLVSDSLEYQYEKLIGKRIGTEKVGLVDCFDVGGIAAIKTVQLVFFYM